MHQSKSRQGSLLSYVCPPCHYFPLEDNVWWASSGHGERQCNWWCNPTKPPETDARACIHCQIKHSAPTRNSSIYQQFLVCIFHHCYASKMLATCWVFAFHIVTPDCSSDVSVATDAVCFLEAWTVAHQTSLLSVACW